MRRFLPSEMTPRLAAASAALGLMIGLSCRAGPAAFPSDRPSQLACETDDDCLLTAYHFEDVPCCNAEFPQVQSKRFIEWRDAWQDRECSRVDCESVRDRKRPEGSPSLPLDCYFEARCNAGSCGGSCD